MESHSSTGAIALGVEKACDTPGCRRPEKHKSHPGYAVR
jgi:hypothetical protein